QKQLSEITSEAWRGPAEQTSTLHWAKSQHSVSQPETRLHAGRSGHKKGAGNWDFGSKNRRNSPRHGRGARLRHHRRPVARTWLLMGVLTTGRRLSHRAARTPRAGFVLQGFAHDRQQTDHPNLPMSRGVVGMLRADGSRARMFG